jgi:hypothetical protein
MLKPAWIRHLKTWMRRPWVRIGLVVVLGTCLWAMVGRRERVVTPVAAGATDRQVEETATPRPPISLGVRRLPQRMISRTAEVDSNPIHADFELSPTTEPEPAAIHAAGFTVEVTANAPVWLTGTIEYE